MQFYFSFLWQVAQYSTYIHPGSTSVDLPYLHTPTSLPPFTPWNDLRVTSPEDIVPGTSPSPTCFIMPSPRVEEFTCVQRHTFIQKHREEAQLHTQTGSYTQRKIWLYIAIYTRTNVRKHQSTLYVSKVDCGQHIHACTVEQLTELP